jgi:hypothetical protein
VEQYNSSLKGFRNYVVSALYRTPTSNFTFNAHITAATVSYLGFAPGLSVLYKLSRPNPESFASCAMPRALVISLIEFAHFRHSREGGNPDLLHSRTLKVWIPAFAGMTDVREHIQFTYKPSPTPSPPYPPAAPPPARLHLLPPLSQRQLRVRVRACSRHREWRSATSSLSTP